MVAIKEIEETIVEEFGYYDDWMGKYEFIIELGKSLPLIAEQYKTEDNLVRGCQSRVWLHAETEGNKIIFTADSDAIITKGLISLLIRVLSHQTPDEIIKTDLSFIDKIGLKEHLSPTLSVRC